MDVTQSARKNSRTHFSRTNQSSHEEEDSEPLSRKLSAKKSKSDGKSQLIRTTTKILLAYVLCWLPYQIASMWRFFCDFTSTAERTRCSDPKMACKLEWLEGFMIFSALLNPFLYTFKDESVSKAQHVGLNLKASTVSSPGPTSVMAAHTSNRTDMR